MLKKNRNVQNKIYAKNTIVLNASQLNDGIRSIDEEEIVNKCIIKKRYGLAKQPTNHSCLITCIENHEVTFSLPNTEAMAFNKINDTNTEFYFMGCSVGVCVI